MSSSHFKPLNNREPQGILYIDPTSWLALVERQNQATEGPQSGEQMDSSSSNANGTKLAFSDAQTCFYPPQSHRAFLA